LPNRILRSSLLQSQRWLDLADNTARLAFIACILQADDLGNFEGGDRHLARLWRDLGIDTPRKAERIRIALVEADLLRSYQIGNKTYMHIPRFRQRVRYVNSPNPRPPETIECHEIKAIHGKKTDSSQTQDGLKSDSSQTQDGPKTAEVKRSEVKRSEVKVSPSEKQTNAREPRAKPPAEAVVLPEWISQELWGAFKAHRVRLRAPMTPLAEKLALKDLAKLVDGGSDPVAVVEQSIGRGWKGLFNIKPEYSGRGNGEGGGSMAERRAAIVREHYFQDERKRDDEAPDDITGDSTRID
jgi:hypothetical protein